MCDAPDMQKCPRINDRLSGGFIFMPNIAISEQTGPPSAGILVHTRAKARFSSPLAGMLNDVARAVTGPIGCRDRDVAAALAPYLGRLGLLDGVACPGGSEKYTRHLLHAGAGYSVLALVWRPRQMSPVQRIGPGACLASIRAG
jgi:hypothetical protein